MVGLSLPHLRKLFNKETYALAKKVAYSRQLDKARAVYDIDPVPVWHSNSVVLIGDASHAMLHHQGQGANSAVLDAGALADKLKAADSIPEALAQFQASRKPVTDELQRLSRQGWSEDEVNSVFPNQHQGEIAARS